jgi:hypothetical protein
LKKNLKKVDTQKPKPGEYYKIWEDEPIEPSNVMRIVKVGRKFAYYEKIEFPDLIQRWDFKKHPECLNNKLTPLEEELL